VHELIRPTRAGLALQPLRGGTGRDEDAVEQILLRVSGDRLRVAHRRGMDIIR